MEILSVSIDLSKIDKSKIQALDKNGMPYKNNAKYYNFDVIVKDDVDQFGKNVAIVEPQTKEQRDAKEKRVYIGNGKRVFLSQAPKTLDDATTGNQPATTTAADDDLPF